MHPQDVIEYWLGPASLGPAEIKQLSSKWYSADAAVDAHIASRFGEAIEEARRGDLLSWADTADGAIAHVILLDQFGRNAYRGLPDAFLGDDLARAVAVRAIDRGLEAEMTVPQRAFLYHPFEHSEELADQYRSVDLFEALAESVDEPWREFAQGFVGYAKGHFEVIKRFGRFPHRNAVLGRENSPEEQEYLDAGGGF